MSTSPTPLELSPIVAGRYAIRGKLGSGGLGVVYLARDPVEQRRVALKVLRGERLLADPVGRMQREFRAVASLRHPRIAAAYDFGYLDSSHVPYYTREYIAGEPLSSGPPLAVSPEASLRPILDLLEALEYLHENEILHLDIHAGNLIVGDDEKRGAVLIDIGLLRAPVERAHPDSSWSAGPPELLEGSAPTARTDLHFVGRLLQERLTGSRTGRPVLPAETPGWGVTRTLALERILDKALQPSPGSRFPTAATFRDALARALGGPEEHPPSFEPRRGLHGRDRELAAIDRAFRTATERGCRRVWIWGPSGRGKTRLLAEAKLAAQLRGLRTVEAGFFKSSGDRPDWMERLRVASDPDASSGAWWDLLSPKHGGSPRERARRAASSFLAAAREPGALLLDDIDAADRETQTFVHALLEECGRRPDDVGPGLAVVVATTLPPPATLDQASALSLEPLAAPQARDAFLQMCQPLELPPGVIRDALERARGVATGHSRGSCRGDSRLARPLRFGAPRPRGARRGATRRSARRDRPRAPGHSVVPLAPTETAGALRGSGGLGRGSIPALPPRLLRGRSRSPRTHFERGSEANPRQARHCAARSPPGGSRRRGEPRDRMSGSSPARGGPETRPKRGAKTL